jgi:hypothetical protein
VEFAKIGFCGHLVGRASARRNCCHGCTPRRPSKALRSSGPALYPWSYGGSRSTITIYIVDYRRDEHVPIIEEAQIALFGDHKPANVVVGIATMSPGYLIEVDAIAVID